MDKETEEYLRTAPEVQAVLLEKLKSLDRELLELAKSERDEVRSAAKWPDEEWRSFFAEVSQETYGEMRRKVRGERARISKALLPDPEGELDIDAAKRADIVALYSSLGWKRQGRRFWCRCPFHGERTASLSWEPEKGLWYCAGCGTGGDAVSFVMRMEDCTFADAVRRMA